MKYLYTVLAILILASCTTTDNNNDVIEMTDIKAAIETTTDNNNDVIEMTDIKTAIETTTNEIDNEIVDIELNDKESEEKMISIDAFYTNPQQEVNMIINYKLNSEDKIESMDVSASNWELKEFNNAVQNVVGMTLEEASEASIAGWSLTLEAFKNALK